MPLPLCQAPADAEASDTEGAERGALQRWDWKGLTYVQTHIPHDRSLARTQASTQKQTGARKRTRANTSKPHLLGAHAVLDAREALPDVALRRGDAAPQLGRLREVVNENQVVAVAADNQKIETKEEEEKGPVTPAPRVEGGQKRGPDERSRRVRRSTPGHHCGKKRNQRRAGGRAGGGLGGQGVALFLWTGERPDQGARRAQGQCWRLRRSALGLRLVLGSAASASGDFRGRTSAGGGRQQGG